jgi:3-methyl-2-oxobutanoate hydroxymethyltransferase
VKQKRVTIPQIIEWKRNKRKISAITAYDYATARLVDEAGIDIILVGDSVAMVAMGHENTLSVTMDEMIHHTRAVKRGTKDALLVGDMPFMSYQLSDEDAVINAGRFIKEGAAEAVKIEGGVRMIDRVKAIIQSGISVIGHVGLTPQSLHQFGGYRIQGKSHHDGRQIKKDAIELQKAGVFSIVIEGVYTDLAEEITQELDIPTIGIGAGPHCDGQILVSNDMLGLNKDFLPKFVKKYADVGSTITTAIEQYIEEVQSGDFPSEEHSYSDNKKPLRKVVE